MQARLCLNILQDSNLAIPISKKRFLVALSIIPARSIARPGEAQKDFHRQLSTQINVRGTANWIKVVIGAMGFSFNKDEHGNYKPFWCQHYYLITSTHTIRPNYEGLEEVFSTRPKSALNCLFISTKLVWHRG